jgi:FlaA1/EpsC-like NDP-sugar epimerase
LIGSAPTATVHPRILTAKEQFLAWPVLEKQLAALRLAVEDDNVDDILAILRRLVPEYAPDGTVVDWVRLQRRANPRRG